MTTRTVEWSKATDAIRAAEKILIVTHVDPDGDAIGSALALANGLSQIGKTVTVADDDAVPAFLQYLPNADTVIPALENGTWDVMISTDASDESRTGKVGEIGREKSRTVINIDHHITNTYFGDIHLVVPSAVSATEIVFDWWQHAGIELNRDIALPLLTGLLTDTLGFRTSNVNARTLEVAQALVEAGASITEVTARALDTKTYQELLLWKQVLPSAEMNGAVLEAVIQLKDIKAAGIEVVTDAGLVGFLNRVNEAMIAVVYKQETEEQVKLSMRSKRGFDVAAVAFELGGGGHKQAAGATVDGTLTEVRNKVLPMLHDAVTKGKLEIV